jgi:8-oxo-dGTP pyrophosphatase MutT (NUDIX family)
MKRVAKLMLQNKDGQYLLLYRSNHPDFGNDPDLPGGTLEDDEEPIQALIREVSEEIGLNLDGKAFEKVHESSKYDKGYAYYLYKTVCVEKTDITLSWEHQRYEWLNLDELINISHTAVDHYMRMVYDYLLQTRSRPLR